LTVADSVEGRRSWRAWLRLGVIALAVAYPVALLLVFLALRSIGERWSVTTLALYLPRVGFGLRPFLTMASLRQAAPLAAHRGLRRALLLFPLMGLEVRGGHAPTPGAPQLRIMSFNIDLAPTDLDELVDAIRATASDIVCLQEAQLYEPHGSRSRMPGWVVREDGQFLSRGKYPIVDVYRPRASAGLRGARLELHPVTASPRRRSDRRLQACIRSRAQLVDRLRASASARARERALLRQLPRYWHLQHNAEPSAMQVSALARTRRVPLSGDHHGRLRPSVGHAVLTRARRYQDGFVEAGLGFGYTTRPGRGCPGSASIGSWRTTLPVRLLPRLSVHLSTHYPVVPELERVTRRERPDRARTDVEK